MSILEDVVKEADRFITPLLEEDDNKQGSQWLLERLQPQSGSSSSDALVRQALALLQKIHDADRASSPDSLYDGALVSTVYGLIDLIVLQGILPSLSPGAAFAQRPKTVLIPTASTSTPRDEVLLAHVVGSLLKILEDKNRGVEPLISQRALANVISGAAELAFSPQTDVNQRRQGDWKAQYLKSLHTAPTSRLLQILNAYLQQQSLPGWLRSQLSGDLSLIPLHPHGVRHVIEFIAFTHSAHSIPDTKNQPLAKGALIPLDAITQASRLLSSVPTRMERDEWFTQLAPQLLDLLDGTDGPEMSKAAGQIIAGGILNRKSTGAPGQIGWKIFAEPLVHAINPSYGNSNDIGATSSLSRSSTLAKAVVPERDLMLALKRLHTISTSYSHPGLIKRLITPLLRPLWGLSQYSKTRTSGSTRNASGYQSPWMQLPRDILIRFLQLAWETKHIDAITLDIFWDGADKWTFGPGSEGGVEIRQRQKHEASLDIDRIMARLARVDDVVNDFVTLLSEAGVSESDIGEIFLQATRRWLSSRQPEKGGNNALMDTNIEEADPLQVLVTAKLSETMARKFQDKFAGHPEHVFELIKQLLDDVVQDLSALGASREPRNISYTSLGNIVKEGSTANHTLDPVSEDIASFSLSLLGATLASKEFKKTLSSEKILSDIIPSLQYLATNQQTPPISSLIKNAATNVLKVLGQAPNAGTTDKDPLAAAREDLHVATKEMSSPEAPNRAWALSTLQTLITDPTTLPIIDIPSTTHVILSRGLADPDSYVYTAAIPVISALAVQVPQLVIRILLDAFLDVNEQSLMNYGPQALDVRLRIGEVLTTFIEGDAFWLGPIKPISKTQALDRILETILLLASRRGQRIKTKAQRTEDAAKEARKNAEAEEAWGGAIPSLELEDDETPAESTEREALQRVVQDWEDTGVEEDVRIRASSVSILGLLLERRLEFVQQAVVDATWEVIKATLHLERTPEKTIVRRAAVLVIMRLLKGMDVNLDDGKELQVGLDVERLGEMERAMRWVESEDQDELCKDHAANVLEAIETWKVKRWFGVGAQSIATPQTGLSDRLAGLDVDPMNMEQSNSRKPVVEELD